MVLSAQELLQSLADSPSCREYVVALSGGMDSIVLLHALCQLQQQGAIHQSISVIHVNHGLQTEADNWQQFCEQQCRQLGVSLYSETVTVNTEGSLETAARQARYEVFQNQLSEDQILLQAHHLDDQMETLLLRLSRGAGIKGLAAIPQSRNLGHTQVFRPLLQYTRQQLLDYAQNHGLQWIEDGSNADEIHDRNYLRHSVLPLIEQRWPEYRASWHKSLDLISESSDLLVQLAAIDLQQLETPLGSLDLLAFRQLETSRQRNVLRYWLQCVGLDVPGWGHLNSLLEDLLGKSHSEGALDFQQVQLRVFDNQLFVLEAESNFQSHPPEQGAIRLADGVTVDLPGNGSILFHSSDSDGFLANSGELEIRYRSGGEELQLPGRPNKPLKNLFQELSIPPWVRSRVPLLYNGESLVCVPGVGVAEEALAPTGSQGFIVDWQMPQLTRSRKDS